jgi:hypothetical protein
MTYSYDKIKRRKRGVNWPGTDEPAMCTRCRADRNRRRSTRGVVFALLKKEGSPYVTPVAYCEEHIPEDLA